jgi:hypothetical protein
VPQFEPSSHWQNESAVDESLSVPAETAVPHPLPEPAASEAVLHSDAPVLVTRHRLAWMSVVVAAALLLVAAATLLFLHSQNSFDAFWKPALRSHAQILVCIADQAFGPKSLLDASDLQDATYSAEAYYTDSKNVLQTVDVTNMLTRYHHAFKVQTQSATNYNDLNAGPVILIGAYNNYWTLRMTAPLRFHFANDPSMSTFWIEDRQNPTRRDWILDGRKPLRTGKDYAILARFVSSYTSQVTYVMAGLGHPSTVESIKYVLSRQLLEDLDRRAPRDWKRKNLEVVIETEAIDGVAGPPRIDAIYTW